jgi:ABC-type multidrug transport system ATPase subunit
MPAMSTNTALPLEAHGLRRRYGHDVVAVDGIDLTVHAGFGL